MRKTTTKFQKTTKKLKTSEKVLSNRTSTTKIRKEKKVEGKPAKFFEAIGRRKTSIARVRLFTQGEKEIIINQRPLKEYFSPLELQQIVTDPLRKMKCKDQFRVSVIIQGGGIHSQSEAARLGISRALLKFNPDFRKKLKKVGFLTRDPRMRERKKFGLKRARKAPQWQKR